MFGNQLNKSININNTEIKISKRVISCTVVFFVISICYAQTLVPYRIGDKWGYAEMGTKKLIIPIIYDYAKPFINDMGMVKIFDKWGFIDKTGNQITPIKYSFIADFNRGGFAYCTYNGKYGWLNSKGVEIVPTIYTSTSSFTTGYFKMFTGDSVLFFDTLGNKITQEAVQNMSNARGEFTLIKTGEKYGLKDESGKIITKRLYNSINQFRDDYAVVSIDNKYGVIDKNGNEVIPLIYNNITGIYDNVAIFLLNDKYGIMDISGKILVQPSYGQMARYHNDLFLATLNSQKSIIDKNGNEIVQADKYSSIEFVSEGLAKVGLNGKYGFIDTVGNEVIPLQYEETDFFEDGLAGITINNKQGFIDKTGKIVIQPKYGYIDGSFENGIVGADNSFTYYPTTYIDKTGQEYVGEYMLPKYGKYPEVSVWNTETRKIKSKNNNEEYTLFINTPRNYKQTNKDYPVVYLLDADYTFGTARDAVESMLFGQEVQEMIIVGIAYDKDFETWFTKRIRDYTPTNDTTATLYPGGGGSDKFLQFINDELIPYVDKNFRAVPNERTLVGYSFGGLFGFYSLFKSPETFSRYLLISPSLWWDNQLAFTWEKDYAKQASDLKAKMYLTVGGNETEMNPPLLDMINLLKLHNYPNLVMNYEETPDRTHFSVFAPAFTKGIKAIFEDK
jgi:predicted alpha/beta superfamily hydrolase